MKIIVLDKNKIVYEDELPVLFPLTHPSKFIKIKREKKNKRLTK